MQLIELTEPQLQSIINATIRSTIAQLQSDGLLPSSPPVQEWFKHRATVKAMGLSPYALRELRERHMKEGYHYRCGNVDSDKAKSVAGIRYEYHLQRCIELKNSV